MYVNQDTVCVLESFVHRLNICIDIKRGSRKSPISHTFVRYNSFWLL